MVPQNHILFSCWQSTAIELQNIPEQHTKIFSLCFSDSLQSSRQTATNAMCCQGVVQFHNMSSPQEIISAVSENPVDLKT